MIEHVIYHEEHLNAFLATAQAYVGVQRVRQYEIAGQAFPGTIERQVKEKQVTDLATALAKIISESPMPFDRRIRVEHHTEKDMATMSYVFTIELFIGPGME
jgi:hypothetical protein